MDIQSISLFVALLAAGIWFALFFVSGVLLSAQGQLLRASLDVAVNTSPGLTDAEKTRMLKVS